MPMGLKWGMGVGMVSWLGAGNGIMEVLLVNEWYIYMYVHHHCVGSSIDSIIQIVL